MRGAQFEMSMKIVALSLTAVFIPGIIAQSLLLFARIAAWYQHRFIDLRARSVSIRNPLPSMLMPRFLPIVALGWAQEKERLGCAPYYLRELHVPWPYLSRLASSSWL